MSRGNGESFIVEIRMWVKLSLFYKPNFLFSFVSDRNERHYILFNIVFLSNGTDV